VVAHEAFRRGQTTTDFLERHFARWQPNLPSLVVAAAAVLEATGDTEGAAPGYERGVESRGNVGADPWQRLGRWRIGRPDG
jgi:hypothetical protein